MSDLRQQLLNAKEDYEQIRYPGNLAADVLYRRRIGPIVWAFLGTAAVAAMVAIAFMPMFKTHDTNSVAMKPTVHTESPTTFVEVAENASLAMPGLPTGDNAPSLSTTSLSMPSMPAIPSFSSLESQATEITTLTTQESA